MSRTKPAPSATPPHPLAKRARSLWLITALFLLIGFTSMTLAPGLAAILVLLSAFFGVNAYRLPRQTMVVQNFNQAVGLQLAGQLDEAEALLNEFEPRAKGRYLLRVCPGLRAQIAFDRGALDGVERETTRLLTMKGGLFSRAAERIHVASALATRALARALAGNDAGALEDATALDTYDEATGGMLGRALLARLAVAARAGDREHLRSLCRASTGMPAVTDLRPRERALYRSYRKLAFSPGSGAYREASNPDAEGSPEAEFFRERSAPVAPLAAPELSAAQRTELVQLTERRALASKKQRRKGRWIGVSVALGALVVAVAAIAVLVPARPTRSSRHARVTRVEPAARVPFEPLVVGGGILLGLLIVLPLRALARRDARRLLRARKSHALGDDAAVGALLEPLGKSKLPVFRAAAHLLQAERAFAAADFASAVARADDAAAIMANENLRAVHADSVVPLIAELRAVSLAALGRIDEARAEHALLLGDCPTYAFRGRAAHRIALLGAVSTGAWAEARHLAATRSDGNPIPLREEMLGDLARMDEAASDVERRRVRDELEESPALRHWIDTAAPGLAARVVGANAHHAERFEAEEDALAEAEHSAMRGSA